MLIENPEAYSRYQKLKALYQSIDNAFTDNFLLSRNIQSKCHATHQKASSDGYCLKGVKRVVDICAQKDYFSGSQMHWRFITYVSEEGNLHFLCHDCLNRLDNNHRTAMDAVFETELLTCQLDQTVNYVTGWHISQTRMNNIKLKMQRHIEKDKEHAM